MCRVCCEIKHFLPSYGIINLAVYLSFCDLSIHVHTHIHTPSHAQTHTHTHTLTHTHTYTHTFTHTHTVLTGGVLGFFKHRTYFSLLIYSHCFLPKTQLLTKYFYCKKMSCPRFTFFFKFKIYIFLFSA